MSAKAFGSNTFQGGHDPKRALSKTGTTQDEHHQRRAQPKKGANQGGNDKS